MSKIRLLLVEDDEDDYIITRDLLDDIAGGDYRLDWASNLDTAREWLSLNEHDVCLMDYELGPVDGVSLLKEAQGLGFTRPIIMLTGQDDERLDQLALSAGAVDYLVKSYLTQSRLARAIRYAVARRDTEQERLERLKAESENRAKTEFLAHLSHELRTPLSSILGYTDLMLRQAQGQQVQQLGVIKRNGHHLLSLLNDVLDLSKIEAGKLEMESHPVDLQRLLSDVYQLLRVRADDKNIALRFELPPTLPEEVKTDPTRLRQILLNLLGNAIKFTHEGEVRLLVSVEEQTPVSSLRCQVMDTGVGIGPDFLPHLFKPFSQAPGTDSNNREGTGLGLAISRQLAQRMGGDIQVASTPGQGSVFTLEVMVELPEAVAWRSFDLQTVESATQPRQLPTLQARILIADDVEDLRVMLGQILSTMSIDTAFAENGEQAVAQVLAAEQEGAAFDLVLMDVQMPKLNGLEATAQLRQGGYDKPIIALTAATMEGERDRCLQAGCSDYLSKPVDESALVKCIRRQLQTRPQRPQQAPANPVLLLVEDDHDAAAMTRLLLANLGWEVQVAHSGQEALQHYQQQQPDLILMDRGLPDCRGDDLARQIRELGVNATRIVALSGSELSRAELNASAFDDHLLKPLDLDVIRSVLEQARPKAAAV
ncbi:response regulator [Ketobacter sp.]|uniref:response regulator n=1 Tax=Ketobacter sp. TaxID=2083498 RepID=UPI000F1A9202|nr:response regulator [Ketobacter sp.]RLT96026.1 MAG: response regulator [Ketobacter sp.]